MTELYFIKLIIIIIEIEASVFILILMGLFSVVLVGKFTTTKDVKNAENALNTIELNWDISLTDNDVLWLQSMGIASSNKENSVR